MKRKQQNFDPCYFFDASETGQLARSIDWSKQALGPAANWPAPLKTALGILFRTRHPMFLFWGDDLTCFFNDAYALSLGVEKSREKTMGQQGRLCWPEIWHIIGPQIDQVMNGGPSTWNVNHLVPIARNGTIEDVYWTYSYSPVLGENGQPAGALVTVSETTHTVLTERALLDREKQASSAMQELYSLFMQAPFPLALLKGPQHQLQFANKMYQNLFLAGKNHTNKTVLEILPESKDQGFIELLDRVYRTGQPYVGKEARFGFRTPQGQVRDFYFNFVYEAVRNPLGEIVGVLAAISDVTDQVLARRASSEVHRHAEERLRGIVDTFPMFVGTLNKRGAITLVNQSAVDVIGQTKEGVLHTLFWEGPWWKSIPMVMETVKAAFAKAAAGQAQRFDTEYTALADGRPQIRWVDLSLIPVSDQDGKLDEVAVSGFDITERIERSKELIAAKAEAEKANQLKSAFLANMSHEIRTPLGVMIGFSDFITDPAVSAEERLQYGETLKRNGEQLSLLVDDILDLSKVESGFLRLEEIEFSLRDALDDVMTALEVKAKEKGLILRSHVEEAVLDRLVSDSTRIKQILFNLVGNALKFTETGEVVISVAPHGGELKITVTDTGIGIPPESQAALFKPFSQADESVTRRFGGTGLGLALSKRLAHLLGGELLLLKSESGRGSTFQLTIKNKVATQSTAAPRKKRPPQITERTGSLKEISILVVDDSPDNQILINLFLSKTGARIEEAVNGFEAVEKALKGTYDLVLMDVQMPLLDGYSATQRLRNAGFRKPIIALTAHAMNEIRQKCLDVGFNDHLSKPINPKLLVQTIAKHVLP